MAVTKAVGRVWRFRRLQFWVDSASGGAGKGLLPHTHLQPTDFHRRSVGGGGGVTSAGFRVLHASGALHSLV